MKAIDEVARIIRDRWLESGHIPEDILIDPALWTRMAREMGENPDAVEHLMLSDCKIIPDCAKEYEE